ncbi:cytochrome c [Pseudomonadota bacterium]
MKLNKILISPLSVSLLLLLGVAQTVTAETILQEEAAQLFREHCAVCHGDHGDGKTRARSGLDPQPRDFTTPEAAAELGRQQMINTVVAGSPGTAMVAWHERLSKAQIDGIVDYIRTTFMTLAPEGEVLVSDQELAQGKAIFEENCRVCHGDRGNGSTWTKSVLDPSPRNFTAPQSRRILTRKRMLASVTFGRKNTAMMSFSNRLSEKEIGYVVDYVRATFMKGPVVADANMTDLSVASGRHNAGGGNTGGHGAGRGHAPVGLGAGMAPRLSHQAKADESKVDLAASFPRGLKGNFKNGRILYLRNCVTCHGARGDGLGPRSYFINPKPRNFLHPDSRSQLNRPELFKAIFIGKIGTVMPAWGKVLGPQQVADVAEFVFVDFIHPDPDSIEAELYEELGDVTDEALMEQGHNLQSKKKAP